MKGRSKKKATGPKKKAATKKKAAARKPRQTRRVVRNFEHEFLDLGYRFKNNTEQWFSVLLRDNCNPCESYRQIQAELEDTFGDDAVYFIPAYVERVGKKSVGIILFDGYVFVKKGDDISEQSFTRKTECLDGVLPNGHASMVITNRHINRLKTKLRHELESRIPKRSDRVMPIEGTFKNLKGRVLSVNRRKRSAKIEFRKKTRIVQTVLSVVNFHITPR